MRKIKILGALIFLVSILLAILFNTSDAHNTQYSNLLKTINQQKAFTQEISKNIFYISKNKESSTKQLNYSIKKFLENMNKREDNIQEIHSDEIKEQSAKIMHLWNQFYILVQKFKDQKNTTNTYSNIILEKTVIDIYNQNLKLVVEFDKLLEISKEHINTQISLYKYIKYALLLLLLFLLIYLFTQLQTLLDFISKFRTTSKNIIQNSTIKDIEPINIKSQTEDISEARDNFNQLVTNINSSVVDSSNALENASKSLEILEGNIEDLMELISSMEEENSIDKDLTKKEDTLIQSLEEVSTSTQNLKDLKQNLENLISHYKK